MLAQWIMTMPAIGWMLGAVFLSEFLSPLLILPLRHVFGAGGSFAAMMVLLACALAATIAWRAFTGWAGDQ